jgi:hypothetical protein
MDDAAAAELEERCGGPESPLSQCPAFEAWLSDMAAHCDAMEE